METVTQIIKPFIKPNFILEHGSIAEEAYLQRGSEVHRWASNYARAIWSKIPPLYEGYCESFKKWFDDWVIKVLFVEQEFIDPVLGFKGHPDFACLLSGENDPVLIDLKTSQTNHKWWQAQIAAYLHLVQINGFPSIKRAGALKLKQDGSIATFVTCEIPQKAFQAFLWALNCYRFFLKED